MPNTARRRASKTTLIVRHQRQKTTGLICGTRQVRTQKIRCRTLNTSAPIWMPSNARGLTGRQLRMARRVAQKHNLAPTSDFDAVRLLRIQGIDPFQRSNLLELVVPRAGAEQREGGPGNMLDALRAQKGGAGSEGKKVQLPQTVPTQRQTLPSTGLSPSERRVKEITEIQRDIARRRRRKLALLLTRLSFFVFLPTFLAGWYFFVIATPMYATKSEFLILQADNTGGGSGLGGLLSGTQFATNQDSIAVQSYLQSKDAMLRLDADAGFKSHFTQPSIDPIQRMNENPSAEEAYKTYKKNVKIGYDPTEGVIRLEVAASDPDTAHVVLHKADRLCRRTGEQPDAAKARRPDEGCPAKL